jgi:hypothetical protein
MTKIADWIEFDIQPSWWDEVREVLIVGSDGGSKTIPMECIERVDAVGLMINEPEHPGWRRVVPWAHIVCFLGDMR